MSEHKKKSQKPKLHISVSSYSAYTKDGKTHEMFQQYQQDGKKVTKNIRGEREDKQKRFRVKDKIKKETYTMKKENVYGMMNPITLNSVFISPYALPTPKKQKGG